MDIVLVWVATFAVTQALGWFLYWSFEKPRFSQHRRDG